MHLKSNDINYSISFACNTFAAIDSKSMAIVILEGNACGFIIRSGRIPVAPQNGISISGHNWEQTPFCPCRLLNLSPMTGFLGCRKRILTCSKNCNRKITHTIQASETYEIEDDSCFYFTSIEAHLPSEYSSCSLHQ